MASHSLTGQASAPRKPAREAMDQDVLQEIISKYSRLLSYKIKLKLSFWGFMIELFFILYYSC